jgi:hypothetical protein
MATLAQIRTKVRNLTGSPSNLDPTDADLDEYINDYYLYRFPFEMATLRTKTWYTFITQPNQAVYDVPQDDLIVEPPIYCGGLEIAFHESPRPFYQLWLPTKTSQNNLATGNGGVNYSFTLYATPVLQGTVVISSGSESFIDNSLGVLTSSSGGTGTINYLTGAVNIVFFAPVTVGTNIYGEWQPYVPSRPRDVLFYDQQFIMRPVPDKAYEVQIATILRPTDLVGSSSEPLFKEWWELLALGAALLIFEDRGDFDQLSKYQQVYDDRRKVFQRRNLMQLSSQRAPSPYDNQINQWPYNLYPGI